MLVLLLPTVFARPVPIAPTPRSPARRYGVRTTPRPVPTPYAFPESDLIVRASLVRRDPDGQRQTWRVKNVLLGFAMPGETLEITPRDPSQAARFWKNGRRDEESKPVLHAYQSPPREQDVILMLRYSFDGLVWSADEPISLPASMVSRVAKEQNVGLSAEKQLMTFGRLPFFSAGSSVGSRRMEPVARAMRAIKDTCWVIEGRTTEEDGPYEVESHHRLALQRASIVRDALIDGGVAADRLHAEAIPQNSRTTLPILSWDGTLAIWPVSVGGSLSPTSTCPK